MVARDFASDAQELLDAELCRLRSLTYEAAAALPEANGRAVVLGGKRCQLTVFRQDDACGVSEALLIVVQVARPWLWVASRHTERGLVFREDGSVREATSDELRCAGG